MFWELSHSILWCLAHHLNKFDQKNLNYILLVFGIDIGREFLSQDLVFR